MSGFNYGIDCQSGADAASLYDYIDGLNIFQDGLDVDEERVSVISNQALLDSLREFAVKNSKNYLWRFGPIILNTMMPKSRVILSLSIFSSSPRVGLLAYA